MCYRNGVEDLNEWMVANGQAVAYTEYSKDYAAAADAARRKKAVRFMPHVWDCKTLTGLGARAEGAAAL